MNSKHQSWNSLPPSVASKTLRGGSLYAAGLTCLILFLSGCSESPTDLRSEGNAIPVGEPIEGALIEGQGLLQASSPTEATESDSNSTSPSTEGVTEASSPTDESTASKPSNPDLALTESSEGLDTENVIQEIPADLLGSPLEPSNGTLAGGAAPDAVLPGFLPVSFERLASFDYEMPEDLTAPVADEDGVVYKEQIPQGIKALNQKAISLKGFMLPLKVEQGLVTEMLIMRDQSMCCYGTVPKINEWVSVRMEKEGVKPVMDEPVTIHGTLKVGEVLENGYLVGIYEMDGQQMTSARTP